MTNSPALWLQAETRTPAAVSLSGFMRVTSWKRRSGWASNKSGASRRIAASNNPASSPGTPYHVFVSPQCTDKVQLPTGGKQQTTYYS